MDEGLNPTIPGGSWASLFKFTTKAHLLSLAVAISLAAFSGVIVPAIAYFLGIIFDAFSDYGTGELSGEALTKEIATYSIYLVCLGSASWVLKGSFFAAWLTFGELQAKSARDQLFAGILDKDMEWHDLRRGGVDSFIPRIQSHIRELQIAVSQPLGFGLQYVVTAVAALGLAFYSSWDLTLITLVGIPFCTIALAWISGQLQSNINGQMEVMNQASKIANNAICSIDTVKCFNGQSSELWQYASLLKQASKFYLKQARFNAVQIGFVRFVVLAMFVQGFWYGNHLVVSGEKTAGQILTCFWAALVAIQTIQQILPQMLVLEKGKAAGATLRAALTSQEARAPPPGQPSLLKPHHCNGDVQFHNVSFTYPSRPNTLALDSADLFFAAGESTFVVGTSGSGKSTLSSLLLKFYGPQAGRITVDGKNIATLDSHWLRNNITVVQQQAVLFDDTFSKNIALGKIGYDGNSEKDLRCYIELADLSDTVSVLAQGLKTLIGPSGTSLSGGQRQKVAIARARLRDTPILILDEATSAMDQASKHHVMAGIKKWREGKTTIVITHDVSLIPDDNYVYVLERGNIAEEGYWEALKQRSPRLCGSPTSRRSKTLDRLTLIRGISQTVEFNFTTPTSPTFSVASTDFDEHFFPKLFSFARETWAVPQDQHHSRRESIRDSLALGSLLAPAPVHIGRTPFRSAMTPPPGSNYREPRRPGSAPGVLEGIRANRNRLHRISIQQGPPRDPEARVSQILELIGPPAETEKYTSMDLFKDALGLPQRKTKDISASTSTLSLREIFATIWPNLRIQTRLALCGAFFFAFIHAASTPIFAWVFSKLLAIYFLPLADKSTVALTWSMALLGVSFMDATASYMMYYFFEMAGQAWVDKLRADAMQRILDQPRTWFDQDNGNLVLCLDRGAEEMRNLLGRFAGLAFVALVMILIAVTWCMLLCWRLTLVGLAAAPLLYTLTRIFEKMSKTLEGKSNVAGDVAGSIFSETFKKIRTVKALTLEDYFHEKHSKAVIAAFKVGVRRALYSGLLFGISDALILFATALIFWYGSQLAASSAFPVQSIITVFTMLLFSISSANGILAFIPQIKMSQDTATQLLRLVNLPLGQSHEHKGQIRLEALPGPISFENLTFSYPTRPDQAVLKSLNLTIPLVRSTALVGASGSGKSTVAALLMGLYSPVPISHVTSLDPKFESSGAWHALATLSSGTIALGRHRFSSLHLPSIRSLVGYVPQQIMLFPGTITKNIMYGLDKSETINIPAAVQEAAILAGIDGFITSLPNSYETLVGEGGTQLSGGQVQRLGIARALARQPQLLIMDEPTSNLDAENASLIRATIRELVRGRSTTVLVITHSIEMMAAMDGIVMLEEGSVVEKGSWDDLTQRRNGRLRGLLGKSWWGDME